MIGSCDGTFIDSLRRYVQQGAVKDAASFVYVNIQYHLC